MKKSLKEYLDDYYFYTSKASEVNRQLAFAGIAIIWIFRNTNDNDPLIPIGLLYPLTFLTLSLGLDLLHYICGSIIWGEFFKAKEKQLNNQKLVDPENVTASKGFSRVLEGLFYFKISFMVICYIFLVIFFVTLLP